MFCRPPYLLKKQTNEGFLTSTEIITATGSFAITEEHSKGRVIASRWRMQLLVPWGEVLGDSYQPDKGSRFRLAARPPKTIYG